MPDTSGRVPRRAPRRERRCGDGRFPAMRVDAGACSGRPVSTGTASTGTGGARAAAAVGLAAALAAGLGGCSIGGDPAGGAAAAGRASARTVRWDTSPDSMAALGDSITRGFDACGILADCPKVSWATGTDPGVRSVAQRLLSHPAGHTWNFARTGTRVADLPGQVAEAVRRKPELVTVMVGGNDACRRTTDAMTSVADFRANFRTAMRTLRHALPRTEVYVASVPNLKRLWSEGRRNALGKQVWKLGICAAMLSDPDARDKASADRRQEVYDRVVAYNTVLKEVCDADVRCRYDGGEVFHLRFTGTQLSPWDWFHPSKDGQKVLAELAYRRITAPGPP